MRGLSALVVDAFVCADGPRLIVGDHRPLIDAAFAFTIARDRLNEEIEKRVRDDRTRSHFLWSQG